MYMHRRRFGRFYGAGHLNYVIAKALSQTAQSLLVLYRRALDALLKEIHLARALLPLKQRIGR
jgi:hypothetical protein